MSTSTKAFEDVEKNTLGEAKMQLLTRLGSSRKTKERIGGYAFPQVPVGGHPGNKAFFVNAELALRLSVLAMILGSLVWMPEWAASIGMTRFAKHSALAVCLMIFMSGTSVGGVINGASAGVMGCFLACLNIFILRGFFPDGVEPGTPLGFVSVPAVVGWIDLGLFNLYMLAGNFRMGFRITGMALNTGFILCFLNPLDQTVFSKNFKINPNGAAVSAFIGTCFGSLAATTAVLLPYPLGFSTARMKDNGKTASEDLCKLYMAAVDYFKGHTATIMIHRQMAQAKTLKAAIDSLGQDICDAYVESFDSSTQGTIRALYEKHASMLGQMFEILDALQIGMTSEDFGDSHKECMAAVGDACAELVDETCILLVAATVSSADGVIDDMEKTGLKKAEETVTQCLQKVSTQFDDFRRKAGYGKVSNELLNESFFIFCISAFGRLTIEYSTILREDAPAGTNFFWELWSTIKGVFQPPLPYHWRICSRYWNALMACFLFSVAIDNYSGACAVTAVFLINTRVGPDVMAMIQGLLAVVVGVVFNALMYSFSCKYGSTLTLMVISFFYWCLTIYIAKSGSSLAGIGLMMSALAPFAIIVACPTAITPEMETAKAVGLWGSIRALLIAVVITVLLEIAHIPGRFTGMTVGEMDCAFKGLSKALEDIFAQKDVTEGLGELSAHLGDADMYNTAAVMEPRLWKCPWKKDFLLDTASNLKKARADLFVMRLAFMKAGSSEESIFRHLNKVEEKRAMQMDMQRTLEDARVLALAILEHPDGIFTGLESVKSIHGLDELDGMDTMLESLNKVMDWPEKAPPSMEHDELVQVSIVFVMFEFLIQHIAAIVKAGVKLS
eukprot:TRINITY_DN1951_c0_g5_i1.p1 TRINITY_DN1951_c0_g5~~TRINITY_DN1951_c0_g5_i1.p1  ORF type:complete len:843 (-),score=270.86 TRINITY_DN1951_c0_g5_i1:159-2687(-)